jgi:hypothetical protein
MNDQHQETKEHAEAKLYNVSGIAMEDQRQRIAIQQNKPAVRLKT